MKRTAIASTLFLLILPTIALGSTAFVSSTSPAGFDSNLDDFEQLMLQAWDLYTQKKYEEALALCVKATALRPNDNRPYAISGAVYMAQWKMRSASEALAKAISLSPGNKRLHYMKAQADRHRNAREEAVASARKAIELDRDFAEAYYVLGDALSIGGKDRDAEIEAYRTSIRLKPDLLKAYVALGRALNASGDKKGAEEVYRRGMEADPAKMAGRFDLGRMLVQEGRLGEARTLYEGRTSDKDNTFPNLITVLTEAEARVKAKENLAKNPNDPDALVKMGISIMEGPSWVIDGRQEKAIVYFRKALEINPDFAQAQFQICKAWVQVASLDKAKNRNVDDELAKLRKMDPKLASDIEAYRKSYKGGITGAWGDPSN
jgi:tetratricopeptide (TPR) repeat protein